MWVLIQSSPRVADLDFLQHLLGAAERLFLAYTLVQLYCLGDLCAYTVERVERGHRLLEHHGDLTAANLAHFGTVGRQLDQIGDLAVAVLALMQQNLAADDFAG